LAQFGLGGVDGALGAGASVLVDGNYSHSGTVETRAADSRPPLLLYRAHRLRSFRQRSATLRTNYFPRNDLQPSPSHAILARLT
jgi:hypothetical protein